MKPIPKIHKSLLDQLVKEYKVGREETYPHYFDSKEVKEVKTPLLKPSNYFVLESKNMVAVFYMSNPSPKITIIVKNPTDTGVLVIDDVIMQKQMMTNGIMPFFTLGTPVTEGTARLIWDTLCKLGMIKHRENGEPKLSYRQVCAYLRKWKDE